MIWLYLIACGGTSDTGDTAPEPVSLEWDYAVQPKKVKFGDQPVGTLATQVVNVKNTGEDDLLFVDFAAPALDGLEVTSPTAFSIAPGRSQDLVVSWVPGFAGTMSDEFVLWLGASTQDTEEVTVPLSGSGQGPVMTISSQEYDFGGVNVGCNADVTFSLTNTGNADLSIETLSLEGDEVFVLTDTTLAEPFPWTLAPFTSRDIQVVYEPVEQNPDKGVVTLTSDAGSVSSSLAGEGMVDGSNVLSYVVGERNKSTILVHVNEVAIEGPYGTFSQHLDDSLPVFFQTLQDNRADYRVAFFWSSDGTVDGSVPYLDDTYSPEESRQVVLDAIAAGGNAGDNDRNFTSLMNAIEEQSNWLFEDDNWTKSKLSLVAINRDVEQSGGHYTQYVEQAQSYKEDPEKVLFHAIAGPYPSGCGVAEPFQGYKEAVDETGGVFLTICESDWTSNMEQLAAASMDGAEFFPLTGSPLISTITVKLDDIPASTGWEYDANLNAIVFEDDSYPREGTVVEINYLKSDGCG